MSTTGPIIGEESAKKRAADLQIKITSMLQDREVGLKGVDASYNNLFERINNALEALASATTVPVFGVSSLISTGTSQYKKATEISRGLSDIHSQIFSAYESFEAKLVSRSSGSQAKTSSNRIVSDDGKIIKNFQMELTKLIGAFEAVEEAQSKVKNNRSVPLDRDQIYSNIIGKIVDSVEAQSGSATVMKTVTLGREAAVKNSKVGALPAIGKGTPPPSPNTSVGSGSSVSSGFRLPAITPPPPPPPPPGRRTP